MFNCRSIPRELRKRRNDARSKSDSEIETSIVLGNERGANEEAGVGAEAIEGAMATSIGVRAEIQGLQLLDVEAHHLGFVVLHPHAKQIHTFHPVEVVADQMTGDADHLLLEGRLPTRTLDLELHHVEDTKTILQDHADDILQADLEPLHVGSMAETEFGDLGDVVMIEQDPTHLQIPLAHVPPEEVEKDVPPPCHLVASHHLRELDIMVEDVVRHLHRALAQQAGFENLRADQENHLPMTVMTEGVAHALIIVRDQDINMTGAAAPAAATVAVKNDFLQLLRH